MALFAGREDAYGSHGAEVRNASKNKLEIKASAVTVRGLVTEELWEAHLKGTAPLGVIPLRADSQCLWGCIDVDVYDALNHAEIVSRLEREKIPLTLCKSKSGGAHLFLFLSAPTPAADLQTYLREMAAYLGFGGSEIFPKQTQILSERGDLGNWLNMPYFRGDRTDRYAVKPTSAAMTVSEFLALAESRKTPLPKMKSKRGAAAEAQGEFGDGPPCLAHLTSEGFPEGTRNNGLFALGTLCRKKFGERWEEVLEEYNRRFLKPPLPAEEVGEIIRRLRAKEYQYRCKDSPLAAHCNAAVCRGRRWGVGGGDSYPDLSALAVLDTNPPLWFATVGDRRVELTTDQLQTYKLFQKRCMEALHVCYLTLKNDVWHGMVGEAMAQVTRIEASPDVAVEGLFEELLEKFCTDRHRAEAVEDILQGRPWEDEETKRHYFRLSDLMSHLEREKFVAWGRNKVSSEVSTRGGRHFMIIAGRGTNVLWIPSYAARAAAPLPRGRREQI